jgi:surface polysaccharide O-acyltransferase-like enzyme
VAISTSSEPGINAFRFVLMFLVVLAHCWYFTGGVHSGEPGYYILITAQCAVPAFFIMSGYFLRWTEGDPLSVTRWAMSKLVPVYAIWVLLYLAAAWIIGMGPFTELARTALTGGPVRHLWFLLALAFGLSAASLSLRLLGPRLTWVVTAMLAAGGLFNGTYGMWFGLDAHPVRAGVFMAPLYVVIGTALARTRIPRNPLLFGGAVLLSYLLQVQDDAFIGSFSTSASYNHWAFTLATLPFGLSMFLFARSLPATASLKWIASRRNYIIVLYCIHPMVVTVINWNWHRHGLASAFGVTVAAYALSLLCAVILSAAHQRRRENLGWRGHTPIDAAVAGPATIARG